MNWPYENPSHEEEPPPYDRISQSQPQTSSLHHPSLNQFDQKHSSHQHPHSQPQHPLPHSHPYSEHYVQQSQHYNQAQIDLPSLHSASASQPHNYNHNPSNRAIPPNSFYSNGNQNYSNPYSSQPANLGHQDPRWPSATSHSQQSYIPQAFPQQGIMSNENGRQIAGNHQNQYSNDVKAASVQRSSSSLHSSNSLNAAGSTLSGGRSHSNRPQISQSEQRHGQSHTPPRPSSSQPSVRESPNVVRRDQAAAWLLASSSQPQPHGQSSQQSSTTSHQSGSRPVLPVPSSSSQGHQNSKESGRFQDGRSQSDSSQRASHSSESVPKRSSTSSGQSVKNPNQSQNGINAHTFYSSASSGHQKSTSRRVSSSTSKPKAAPKSSHSEEVKLGPHSSDQQSSSHDRKHALPANGTSNPTSRAQMSQSSSSLAPISKNSAASSSSGNLKELMGGKTSAQIGSEVFGGGKKSNTSHLLNRTPLVQEKKQDMEEDSPDPLNVISPAMAFAQRNGTAASPLGKKRKDSTSDKKEDEEGNPRPKKIRLKLGPNPSQSNNSSPRRSPQKGRTDPMEENLRVPDSQSQVIEDSEEEEMEEDEYDEEEVDELDAFIPLNTPQSERPSDTSSAQSSGRMGRVSMGPVKMSDKRNNMTKLIELIEDVLEADDALPDKDTLMAIDSGSALPAPADSFFDLVSGRPILNTKVLSKLLRYVRVCAQPLIDAPARTGGSPSKPADATQLSDIPHQELSRVLRILERAVKSAEIVDPFPVTSSSSHKDNTPKKKGSKSKKPKARSVSKSRTPQLSGDEREDEMEEDDLQQDADESDRTIDANRSRQEGVEVDMDSLQRSLSSKVDAVAHSVLAAECCLTMLAADQLPKALVSEDLIRHCVEALKASLEKTLLPFVEACGSVFHGSLNHPVLEVLVESLAPVKPKKGKKADPIPASAAACSRSLTPLFHQSSAALTQLQKLVKLPSINLPDSIVIAAVYVGLAPFFALEPEPASGSGASEAAKAALRGRTAMNGLGGDSAMRSLRLPALNLLRNIFARHSNQRQWTVEEILTSLIKLPDLKKNRRQHGLRNGRAINSVNALLLQLVQTAVFGIQSEDGEDAGAVSGVARAVAELESESQAAEGAQVDDEGTRLRMASKGLDGPDQTAKTIAAYLMQRVGQNKTTKASAEVTYSSIVDSLMTDLLHTLFLPEWPASSLLLSRFCLIFAATLEDPKSTQDAKAVALEHLGSIAVRLRQNEQATASSSQVLLGINKSEADWNVEALESLSLAYRSVLEHHENAESDDQTAESASEFFLSQWASELSKSLIRTDGAIKEATEGGSTPDVLDRIKSFRAVLLREFSSCGSPARSKSDNLFEKTSEEDYAKVSGLTAQVMPTTNFMVTFNFARQQLVAATKEGAVGNRSRALRGLSNISAVDSSLLDRSDVRMAVEERLIDASSGVRESAIGLLGKYVLRDHARIATYYEQIAGRILDSGLGVRKRVLRLLAKFFSVATEPKLRIDACVRIVRCVNDEDVGVQTLAVSTIGEMWLGLSISDQGDSKSKAKRSAASDQEDESFDKSFEKATQNGDHSEATSSMASIILSVSSLIRERPSPLEEVFRRLLKKRGEGGSAELLSRLRELNNTMIDSLVESHDAPAAETINRIKTIHILVSTNPTILSVGKAKLLLPYLKIPKVVEPEDLLVVELLFKVFKTCLPSMPRTASAFARALEKSLTPLMGRPPMKPATIAMQELVGCFCTTIRCHTRNYQLLVKVLLACDKRFKPLQDKATKDKDFRLDHASAQVMSLTALLCEHGNFDDIRENSAELRTELNQITKGSIVSYISESILALYNASNPSFRSPYLQCLGFIFRSHPSLMLSDEISEVMDNIFKAGSGTDRELLLKIILESLSSNQHSLTDEPISSPSKKKVVEVERVNMDELVGNTDKFADSGVGSSLVQRYLGPILESAKDVGRASVQRAAAEIIKQVVMQGLAHPLQCVPTLIALETSSDEAIAARAFHLHSHLSSKHGSILAARYLDLAKASFEFQLKQTSYSDLRGHRSNPAPMALLHAWYSLLRDRRQSRLDFLKALVKSLDLDMISKDCSENSVAFARYIADNLATFDYKTLEEVFAVVSELKSILSVSGIQVLHLVKLYTATPSSSGAGSFTSSENSPRRPSNPLKRAMLAEQEQEQFVPSSQPNERMDLDVDSKMVSIVSETRSTARMSTVMGTVLLLRNHLKSIYNLSEAKCAKYIPSKKNSAGGDRPATKKSLSDASLGALSFDAMPLALVSFEGNTADAVTQMQTYEDMIGDEGTLNEPEDIELDD